MVPRRNGAQDGLVALRLPPCQIADEHHRLVAEPTSSLEEQPLDIRGQRLVAAPALQVRWHAAHDRIDGEPLVDIVARQETFYIGEGQRRHRELARESAVERRLVLE